MQLNTKALAWTAALLWGGCFFLVGIANFAWSSYGIAWLQLGASIYPGYGGPGGIGSVVVVTLYALVDGAVAGALFGWVYNMIVGSPPEAGALPD